jgi:hypothetical protein
MGHYERGTNRIIPVQECPVHSMRANRIAFALRDRLVQARITAAGPSLTGILRHLLIRTTMDDREAVAMLVVTRNDKSLRRPVRDLLDAAERPDGFFINIHDAPGPYMIGSKTIRIAGRSHVRETAGGFSYLISPRHSFRRMSARPVCCSVRLLRVSAPQKNGLLEFSICTAAAGCSRFHSRRPVFGFWELKRIGRLSGMPKRIFV